MNTYGGQIYFPHSFIPLSAAFPRKYSRYLLRILFLPPCLPVWTIFYLLSCSLFTITVTTMNVRRVAVKYGTFCWVTDNGVGGNTCGLCERYISTRLFSPFGHWGGYRECALKIVTEIVFPNYHLCRGYGRRA